MESPFASRLGTKFVPNDKEAVEIRKILDKHTPKLAQILSELARVRALYEELENQHKRLADDMDAHRKLLSLPRRNLLPTDILQEIFLSCLPTSHDSIITKKEAPTLLTQVCSSWRCIALNTPRLWASIHIPITITNLDVPLLGESGDESLYMAATDLCMSNRLTAVREWLSRSKDCQLSFTFGSDPSLVGPNKHCEEAISLLLLQSTRWRRISVYASKYYVARFMALDAGLTPLLESVTISEMPGRGWGSPAATGGPSQVSLFENSNLRILRLSHLTQDIASLPVRWAALSHLSLYCNLGAFEEPQIFELLKFCTRIVSFKLSTAFRPGLAASSNQANMHPPSSTVVSLPFLEKLSLFHQTEAVYPDICDSVEVPALQEIDYHWPYRRSAQPPLLSLLRRQGHRITTLSTNIELFSEENFRSCLLCCPHLKKLVIVKARLAPIIDDEGYTRTTDVGLLESLSSLSSSGEYLCPELEVLDSFIFTVSSDQDVLDFLARKQVGTVPGLSKLKKLGLTFQREQNQPIAEFVQPYIEGGLDLVLAYQIRHKRVMSMYDHMPMDTSDVRPERYQARTPPFPTPPPAPALF